LAREPCHGYELLSAFHALVGGRENWEVKPAQVYTTLARLAYGGLVAEQSVEKEAGPEKRIYAITPAGREELAAWFRSGVLGEHQRDEFFVKLMLGLAMDEVDVRKLIQTQRSTLYQELHHVTGQRQQADPASELAHILLLDKMVMHLEADLLWLDMVEARLDEMQRQPFPRPEPRPRGRPPRGGRS
jgi:DNA-binding PadR family transcriptional regulator